MHWELQGDPHHQLMLTVHMRTVPNDQTLCCKCGHGMVPSNQEKRNSCYAMNSHSQVPMVPQFLTENDAKHTFKLLAGCYKSGFAMDLQLVKTINVSID